MKRVWVIFNEDFQKALLVNNVPVEVTNEEIRIMCENSDRTVNKIKETDPKDRPWQFTNTREFEWQWLVDIKSDI